MNTITTNTTPSVRYIFLLMQFDPSTSKTYPMAAYDSFREAERWCDVWNDQDGDGPVRYMVQSLRFYEGESI